MRKTYFDKGILDFLIFPTHQLQLNFKNQVERTYHEDLRSLFALKDLLKERYHELDWYPDDFDPREWGQLMPDTRKIRQKSRMWKQIRVSFQMSGTDAYVLLGFFVPKDRIWRFREEKVFSEEQIKAMDHGKANEDVCILAYMKAFPQVHFYEQGLWSGRYTRAYSNGWAASPDGIAVFPEDQDRYVLEFKCSEKDCDFKAYYYPQIYMEMIMTSIRKHHLVRFKEERGGEKFRFFEEFLDENLLSRFLYLWQRALSHDPERLQDLLLFDKDYKDMRNELFKRAKDKESFYELDLENDPLLQNQIEIYRNAVGRKTDPE